MTQRRGPFLGMSSSQAKNFALPTLLPKRSDFFSSLLEPEVRLGLSHCRSSLAE